MDSINSLLARYLTLPLAVPIILLFIALLFARVLVFTWRRHLGPIRAGLAARLAVLGPVEEAANAPEAQARFAADFGAIDEVMRTPDTGGLTHGWTEYVETIVDPNAPVIQATARPQEFFDHLGHDSRLLAWWANLFVAIGLTFTFLGIVAALSATSEGLRGASSNPAGMADVLTRLLALTSAKFWTSIAGVGCSIALHMIDRRWHHRTRRDLARLVRAIERGTQHLPPQRLALDQLRELRQQSTALSEFSTQLAVGISDAFAERMQPVVAGLSGIQQSIDEFRNSGFQGVGEQLGDAVREGAGEQMAALAGALTDMTAKLARVNEGLAGSGQAASEQMTRAAEDFAAAARELVSAMRETLLGATEASEGAMKQALDQFQGVTAGINDAFDAMRGQIAELGVTLAGSAEATAARNADLLDRAARALEGATAQAATGIGKAVDEAVAKAADDSLRMISAAFERFGERFNQETAGLVDALRATAGRIEASGAAFGTSTAAAGEHARLMGEANREMNGVSQQLGRAAGELQTAAQPVREAVTAIRDALAASQKLLTGTEASGRAQQAAAERVSTSLTEAGAAIEQAWRQYRESFQGASEALGAALARIRDASGEHAGKLDDAVTRVDVALAKAVDRLQHTIEPLGDLATSLEDARKRG